MLNIYKSGYTRLINIRLTDDEAASILRSISPRSKDADPVVKEFADKLRAAKEQK